MKYVQLAMRRNGLHAIRGWCLNQLKLVPEMVFASSGDELEGRTWFNWRSVRQSIDTLTRALCGSNYITLETYPLHYALEIVEKTDATLILHIRSLENWLASSYALGRCHDWKVNVAMWEEYVEYGKTHWHINYDKWVLDKEYRIECAAHLGVQDEGEPYQRVHGIQFSSFDSREYDGRANEMKVTERWKQFVNDPVFRGMLDEINLQQ